MAKRSDPLVIYGYSIRLKSLSKLLRFVNAFDLINTIHHDFGKVLVLLLGFWVFDRSLYNTGTHLINELYTNGYIRPYNLFNI